MSSRFLNAAGAAAIAAMLGLSTQTSSAQITFPWERSQQGSPQGQAQSDDADLEMRIQRLESQLRQLTGQNEELQFRNRQLEDRLRQLGAAPPAPGGQPPMAQPSVAAAPPAVQPGPPQGQQGLSAAGRAPAARLSAGPTRLRPAAADRLARADRAGPGSPAGRRPPPRRCLRPEPESQRPGRAARARRRPDADAERSGGRRVRAGAVRANRSISAVRAIPVAPCRRPLQPHRHRAAPGPAPAPR